jgi:ubiquinone/menaquinone biosynthesis C-methylase UbiE
MWWSLLVACVAAEPNSYMGRPIAQTMGAAGAAWLTRPERVAEEDPDQLHRVLALKPGQTACDVGAGNGYHTLRMARAVGPTGKVVATDIQAAMLGKLRARAEAAGIDNVELRASTPTDANLPAGGCDVVLLVDVYHEFSDPEAMLAGIRASLSPGGRVALVEYRAEDPRVPMKPLHEMTAAQCDREFLANGFQKAGRHDGLPWQHLLFYTADAAFKGP